MRLGLTKCSPNPTLLQNLATSYNSFICERHGSDWKGMVGVWTRIRFVNKTGLRTSQGSQLSILRSLGVQQDPSSRRFRVLCQRHSQTVHANERRTLRKNGRLKGPPECPRPRRTKERCDGSYLCLQRGRRKADGLFPRLMPTLSA